MILRLTTIGRQTLADGANRVTRAVTLTRRRCPDRAPQRAGERRRHRGPPPWPAASSPAGT